MLASTKILLSNLKMTKKVPEDHIHKERQGRKLARKSETMKSPSRRAPRRSGAGPARLPATPEPTTAGARRKKYTFFPGKCYVRLSTLNNPKRRSVGKVDLQNAVSGAGKAPGGPPWRTKAPTEGLELQKIATERPEKCFWQQKYCLFHKTSKITP